MRSSRLKIYAMYSASYEVLLNDFFIPSLKNTDLELALRKIESVDGDIFGSQHWSQTMLEKVTCIIDAVQENWGDIFVVSDVDVQFFKNVSQNLRQHLVDNDIVFQSNDYSGRINAGFFACRAHTRMLHFWQEVHSRLEESIRSNRIHTFAEQYFIREILAEKSRKIRFDILPADEYCSPRMAYIPGRKIVLSNTLRMYHATWTSCIDDKRYHLRQVLRLVQENRLMIRLYFFLAYFSMIFRYPGSFFQGTREGLREKYQMVYKKIAHKRASRSFSGDVYIFMKKGLQFIPQIYFCVLYFIKKRDYSCYPFIGDILWHRHGSLYLPGEPVIFHSSKNGFFSIFIEALGYLDYCEKRGYSPNILLDTGYYLDVHKGANWWEYYFERVIMKGDTNHGHRADAQNTDQRILPDYENIFGDYSRSHLSLNRKNEIFRKYIKIHDTLLNEIDTFVREEFRDFYVIGCHIRGTDKRTEIRRKYSIETVIKEIDMVAQKKSNFKIFLATDDEEYYLTMKAIYKDKIISRDCTRLNGPIHLNKAHQGYSIGKDVLLDCLILSKCHYFIGGSSNVSHGVLIVNPNIQHKIIKFNC